MKNTFSFLLILILTTFLITTNCKKAPTNEVENKQSVDYSKTGMDIALTTKAQLGKNLIGTIQKEGTINALEFCNINAFPLTDSMAKVHKATIKRVSDKPRNIENKANTLELKHINTFKSQILNSEEAKPIVDKKGDIVHFYAPILTNQLCLQCHGKIETDIKPDVLQVIDSLYPKDIAKGYGINEVRGIWSIEMNTK